MWKVILAAIIAVLAGIGFCVWEVGRDDGYFEKTRHR